MANVFDVADFFIQIANQSEDDQMTNLKLNKLLYYAQGVYLARTGRPLFDENIEAWTFGPVIPNIYRKYKVCGRNPIASSDDIVDRSHFTSEELETLLDVMREFGQYTGTALVTMTHRAGTPWSDTNSAGKTVINKNLIKAYFLAHPVPKFTETISVPKVHALPSEWYNAEEDAEWEAYL